MLEIKLKTGKQIEEKVKESLRNIKNLQKIIEEKKCKAKNAMKQKQNIRRK